MANHFGIEVLPLVLFWFVNFVFLRFTFFFVKLSGKRKCFSVDLCYVFVFDFLFLFLLLPFAQVNPHRVLLHLAT